MQRPLKHRSRQKEPVLGIFDHLNDLLHAESEADLVVDIKNIAGLPFALEETLMDEVDEKLKEHLLGEGQPWHLMVLVILLVSRVTSIEVEDAGPLSDLLCRDKDYQRTLREI